MIKQTSYLKIPVGSISPTKANQEVIKQLMMPKKQQGSMQEIIDWCDTKIQEPRFR